MLALEFFQRPDQAVVTGVRNDGVIQKMVPVIMLLDFGAKFIYLVRCLAHCLLFLAAHAGTLPDVFKPENSVPKMPESEQAPGLFRSGFYPIPFHRRLQRPDLPSDAVKLALSQWRPFGINQRSIDLCGDISRYRYQVREGL